MEGSLDDEDYVRSRSIMRDQKSIDKHFKLDNEERQNKSMMRYHFDQSPAVT